MLFSGTAASANPITLAWDPSTSEDVAGYTVRYGTSPGIYSQQVDAGNTTSITLPKLPTGTYYFVVQAYSNGGFTSTYSNQLVVTIGSTAPTSPSGPVLQPGSCSTPDPFTALGGGTCYAGAWLPPGMAPPASTAPAPVAPPPAPAAGGCTTPDPFVAMGGGVCLNGGWIPGGAPAPTPSAPAPPPSSPSTPPPAPAPSTGGCTTADPFVAIGGGVCVNGGWIPGGAPSSPKPPSAASTPSTPSTPPPPPPPNTGGCTTADPFVAIGGGLCVSGGWVPAGAAPSSPKPAPPPSTPSTPPPVTTPPPAPTGGGTCTVADPFASMGGGTCYNGGWLPPGMPIPGGGTSAPAAPAPAPPQPPAPPSLTSCITPDPFAMIGGGTCYNGGWLPPGMTPPQAEHSDVIVTGTVHVIDAENGVWVIEAEDGTLYTSSTQLPEEILEPGAIVLFHGTVSPTGNGDNEIIVVEIISIEIQK